MQSSQRVELDLDSVNNLEEHAYHQGYQQGHEHGALHGTFEGRELGRDKGYEVWEEVGFYQGMAKIWRTLVEASSSTDKLSRKQLKQLQHLRALQRLVAAFPMQNKSSESSDTLDAISAGHESTMRRHAADGDDEDGQDSDEDLSKLDMLALLERIRARYRLTCSVLGVRPRGAVASKHDQTSSGDPATSGGFQAQSKTVLVAGKMVDPSQLRY